MVYSQAYGFCFSEFLFFSVRSEPSQYLPFFKRMFHSDDIETNRHYRIKKENAAAPIDGQK